MNSALALAAGLLAATGVAHSVLGELWVFRRLRTHGGLVPTGGRPVLGERQVRILWATWHLITVLGCAFSALLWRLAAGPGETALAAWLADGAAWTLVAGGVLVLYGTNGRHPAWAVLLLAATLVWWR